MAQNFLDTRQKVLSLAACCWLGFLQRGVSRVYSLLFVASLTRYNISRKTSSIPFILLISMNHLSGPVSGYLNSKIGLRVVMILGCVIMTLSLVGSFLVENFVLIIIFIGIFYGFALGFVLNLIPQALLYHFKSHIDKASGFYHAASTVGGLACLALANFLLEVYDTSGTFLILAGITLNGIPAAMLLWKPRQKKQMSESTVASVSRNCETVELAPVTQKSCDHEKECDSALRTPFIQNKDSNDEIKLREFKGIKENKAFGKEGTKKPPPSSLFRLFLDPVYIFLSITQSSFFFVNMTFWTIILDAAMDKGISKEHGVLIVLGAILVETFGKIFPGYFTDTGYITRTDFAAICCGIIGTSLLLFVWINEFVLVIIIFCLCSALFGSLMSVGVGILSMFVEKSKVRMACSSRFFLYVPMSICHPFIIGYFRDILKSYDGLFYLSAIVIFVAAFMFLVTPTISRLLERRKKSQETEL